MAEKYENSALRHARQVQNCRHHNKENCGNKDAVICDQGLVIYRFYTDQAILQGALYIQL